MAALQRNESWVALIPGGDRDLLRIDLGERGEETNRVALSYEEFAHQQHDPGPRWVLRSARDIYPQLLTAGVRLERIHDLVLCHAILRDTALAAEPLVGDSAWRTQVTEPEEATLFAAFDDQDRDPVTTILEQFRAQRRVIDGVEDRRLALLCAAESAGALVAEEMRAAGLPWDAGHHDLILRETLGTRPVGGGLPRHMQELAQQIRDLLGDRDLSLDSQPKLLRALHRAGIFTESTSRWELQRFDHPVIAPLIAYKKLSRLLTANGWNWLEEWVKGGRFRPVYIPGGVVTGRWASAGGGALQIPRQLRPAVRADPGWMLVVADVAQLEPRMLAAMSGDSAMARAAQGADLYAGIVESGAVATREEAKYAVLGAMYGATTGDSGRLVPQLRKVFPRAMKLVDDAARTGEDGGVVSTWLGRSSPRPSVDWIQTQAQASEAATSETDMRRARQRARDRGRFTRNFVVQGTAAEWALIWLAEIRHRLNQLPEAEHPALASGPFARKAHLAFFLHDEVILHVPEESAERAVDALREATEVATKRLFGEFPIDVPLDLRITRTAEK